MPRSSRRRERRSRKEQQELVEQFETSGLVAQQFCRREGVALSSLQRWRRTAARPGPADFVELLPSTRPTTTPPNWFVEVVFPNGTSLRFRE